MIRPSDWRHNNECSQRINTRNDCGKGNMVQKKLKNFTSHCRAYRLSLSSSVLDWLGTCKWTNCIETIGALYYLRRSCSTINFVLLRLGFSSTAILNKHKDTYWQSHKKDKSFGKSCFLLIYSNIANLESFWCFLFSRF